MPADRLLPSLDRLYRALDAIADEEQRTYEEDLLSGRYVITASLDITAASTAQVVSQHKSLQSVENRFRVMKDFLASGRSSTTPKSASSDMSASACSRR
jgi:hypothetical protein